jgi:hypothetical protein
MYAFDFDPEPARGANNTWLTPRSGSSDTARTG